MCLVDSEKDDCAAGACSPAPHVTYGREAVSEISKGALPMGTGTLHAYKECSSA